VYASTESTLRSPQSSPAERFAALDRREMAASSSLAAGQAQATMQLAQAGAQFGAAVGAAIGAATRAMAAEGLATFVKERFRIVERQTGQSIANHQFSLGGGYYIRPVRGDGWGLAIIDLASGKRADIVATPPSRSMRNAVTANLPAFALDPRTKRLVVKGLGLDAAQYVPYQIDDIPTVDQSTWGWILPYPSVLDYDLTKLPFREVAAADAEKPGHESSSPADEALLAAARVGDVAAMKRALSAGANVNARDAFGRTALMLATNALSPDAVDLLGERGADPYITDPEGFTAWEYFALPPRIGRDQATVRALQRVFKKHKAD
jgi:hypothetical protein